MQQVEAHTQNMGQGGTRLRARTNDNMRQMQRAAHDLISMDLSDRWLLTIVYWAVLMALVVVEENEDDDDDDEEDGDWPEGWMPHPPPPPGPGSGGPVHGGPGHGGSGHGHASSDAGGTRPGGGASDRSTQAWSESTSAGHGGRGRSQETSKCGGMATVVACLALLPSAAGHQASAMVGSVVSASIEELALGRAAPA